MTMANAPNPAVQRQIVLPMSKAVEIAYKNIRLRLSRSLLVTSGIVLALAFLMSVLVGEAMVGSMRQWAATPEKAATTTEAAAQQRDDIMARQRLESILKSKGVPLTPQEIASSRTQQR